MSIASVTWRVGRLLRQRTARALWLGQVTSVTGDRLYGVALTWTALTITRSPLMVGLVSLAGSVPFLAASLVSGAVADRRDALHLARIVDLGRGMIMMVPPVAAVFGALGPGVFIPVAAAVSGLEAFFLPSLQASLPRLVEPNLLRPLVSLLDSTDRLGRTFGAGAVGVLVAVIPEIQLFSINAATFVVSALFLTVVIRSAVPWTAPPVTTDGSKWRMLTGGWVALWHEGILRRATILRGIANVAWPAYTVSVPFLIERRFRLGISAYGLSFAVFGIGNVVGNIASGRLGARRPLLIACIAWTCAGVGFAAIATARSYAVFLGAIGISGVCTPLANVTIDSHIAAHIRHDLLARSFAAQRFLVVVAGTVGLPLFGFIAQTASATTALVISAAMITMAAMIVGISGRRLRPPHGTQR